MLLVAYIMSVYIMQCKIMFPLFYGFKPPTLFSGFKRLRSTGGMGGGGGKKLFGFYIVWCTRLLFVFGVLNLFFIYLA